MKHTTLFTALAAVVMLTTVSCMTVPDPETIPQGLSVAELNQMAQAENDKNNYKAAEVYYNLIIERYGADPVALTAAEFEIAHISVKKKHYEDAAQRLETIIARYETSGGAGLPPKYLVLSRNDLAKIPSEYLNNQEPPTGEE